MIHIHDAFELAFAIIGVFPCIFIIIVYSFLRKELKPTNYYKLQLIISILINIILNFVKDYGFDHNNNTIYEDFFCNNFFKYFAVSKSYFEIVNLFFLTSFMILLNYLLVKGNTSSKIVFIILSLINWVLPMYIIFIYIALNDKVIESYEIIDNSYNVFYSITGQCVYFSKIKRLIHLFLIPCLFLADVVIYILLCRILILKKKEDKDNSKSYKVNIRRITINFISHIFFFGVQYADIFFLDCFIKGEKECNLFFYYEYYNIVNNASFSIISFTCIFERRIMSFLNEKFTCCLSEKESCEESEEEEEDEESYEYEEYDENEEIQKIYDDRTTMQTNDQ